MASLVQADRLELLPLPHALRDPRHADGGRLTCRIPEHEITAAWDRVQLVLEERDNGHGWSSGSALDVDCAASCVERSLDANETGARVDVIPAERAEFAEAQTGFDRRRRQRQGDQRGLEARVDRDHARPIRAPDAGKQRRGSRPSRCVPRAGRHGRPAPSDQRVTLTAGPLPGPLQVRTSRKMALCDRPSKPMTRVRSPSPA